MEGGAEEKRRGGERGGIQKRGIRSRHGRVNALPKRPAGRLLFHPSPSPLAQTLSSGGLMLG